jgi:hypothetical protein
MGANEMSYDIIGDIHGCGRTLESLLSKLGYLQEDGVYRHPERTAVFLGDFIDRGPHQRDVISIVKPMIESGAAQSVMGNHEYNAIAFATRDERKGGYLRAHSDRNLKQHEEFLDEYAFDSADHREVIDWFKSLPMWLELDGIRVIHACWDWVFIEQIGDPLITNELLLASCDNEQWQFDAIETLLKGKELPLPAGHHFNDKFGNPRHDIRVRWWDQSADTYKKAFLGPESALTQIPDDEINGDHLIDYSHDAPPVFLGHYWMEGEPEPLAANIACTDYSVAKAGGKLAAYRWDGEQVLDKAKYVAVERVEPQ